MRRIVTSGAVLVALSANLLTAEGTRPQVSLDGPWQFRLDPKAEGEAAGWFADTANLPDRIQVPGNWQAQGFGEPGGIVRHNYQGKAWYRRTVRVPAEWKGRRVWLRFEGVCNWGEVYLDGAKLGRVESFITPYEFDVTGRVTPGGEHRLDVLVDSRTPPDAHYMGMMQFLVATGGITSHVVLEARSDPWLDRVSLTAEPGLKSVLARVAAHRSQTGTPWRGRCRVRVLAADGRTAAEGETLIAFAGASAASATAERSIAFPELRPWSPDNPQLYRVEISLLDAQAALDAKFIRTGFRTLVTDAGTGNFILNGQPLFLRGCGYDSLEPIHGSPPPDKQVYVDRLRHLKAYGFNFVRFLAHTPLREFFEAADEVGLLVQTEGEWFLAAAPMPPGTAALFQAQVPRMIREFENHPSWYAFSCFNEAFNAHQDPVKQGYIQSACQTFRALKPDHYFLATDGGGDQWPTDVISDRWAMARAETVDEARDGTPRQVFRGTTAEVSVYHRVLSEAEVRTLAATPPSGQHGLAVRELQPAAYWPQQVTAPGVFHAKQAEKSLPSRGGAFSVSAWVRPEGFAKNDWGTFFSCGAAETGRALILALDGERADGRLMIGRYFDNILPSGQALTAGQWNHVAFSYDGRRIRLWMNSRADAELDATLEIPPVDLAIGRLVDTTLRKADDYRVRPHVWHEFDNTYIAPLPDLDIERRLTGTMTQSWVLEPHRRRLDSYGLLPRYGELRQASIARYRQYVKQAFERARQMPRLDGYSWWVVSDIPGGVETDVTSYGVLDLLYQPEKFPDPAWFRQFNRESVLLIDADIDQRVLSASEQRTVRLSLSHYGAATVERGELGWRVSHGQRILKEGRIIDVQAVPARISPLGEIALGPFDFDAPAALTLAVELRSAACCQSNQWEFWVFPARKRDLPAVRMVNLASEPLLDECYAAADRKLEGSRLALSTQLTPPLLAWVQAGGCAILLEQNEQASSVSRPGVASGSFRVPSGILRQPGAIPYWPLWLRCDAQLVENHPALGDFPHDGFSGFQFLRLFGMGVPTVDFTPRNSLARQRVQPIIWGLSLVPWQEDASPFGYALAYGAMLSEGRLGEGRILICNLWVLDGIRRRYPEAGYLLDCLVAYAAGDASDWKLEPLSADDARALFRSEAGPARDP